MNNNFSKELIESKLRQAALKLVHEERLRLVADVLSEEVASDSLPGIIKWDRHEGIGSRHSYSFRHPSTKIKYTIDPSSNDGEPYHVTIFHPDDMEPISFGTHASTNAAAKICKGHHDAICGMNEASIVPFETFITEAFPFFKRRFFRRPRKRLTKGERQAKIYQLAQEIKYAKSNGLRHLFSYARKKLNEMGLSLRQLGLGRL